MLGTHLVKAIRAGEDTGLYKAPVGAEVISFSFQNRTDVLTVVSVAIYPSAEPATDPVFSQLHTIVRDKKRAEELETERVNEFETGGLRV